MQTIRPPVLVLACGALANEVLDLCQFNRWTYFELQCLPAHWHNRPEHIAPGVKEKLTELAPLYERVLIGYGDCGSGGLLDEVIDEFVGQGFRVERIPGAHCYEFFAGGKLFEAYVEEELGTFYLTDFLVRHFDQLVMKGMGIDKHPELLDLYFGNYKRLMYLAQVVTDERLIQARAAAERLGLAFEYRVTGYGDLERAMHQQVSPELEKVITWQS
jgi:hypothetical protein